MLFQTELRAGSSILCASKDVGGTESASNLEKQSVEALQECVSCCDSCGRALVARMAVVDSTTFLFSLCRGVEVNCGAERIV